MGGETSVAGVEEIVGLVNAARENAPAAMRTGFMQAVFQIPGIPSEQLTTTSEAFVLSGRTLNGKFDVVAGERAFVLFWRALSGEFGGVAQSEAFVLLGRALNNAFGVDARGQAVGVCVDVLSDSSHPFRNQVSDLLLSLSDKPVWKLFCEQVAGLVSSGKASEALVEWINSVEPKLSGKARKTAVKVAAKEFAYWALPPLADLKAKNKVFEAVHANLAGRSVGSVGFMQELVRGTREARATGGQARASVKG